MMTAQDMKRIFREADIEGLISNGAPDNEYDSEAEEVMDAISRLRKDDLTEQNIAAIIVLIWARMFNRDEMEIEMRLPAFRDVARKILG
jgi:hypothetical protein